MKVWSTRKLVSKGIQEFNNAKPTNDGWCSLDWTGYYHRRVERLGRDCFLNRDEALAAAIGITEKRLASSRRSVEKLERMLAEFERERKP